MTKRQLFLVRKALRCIEAAEIARLDAGPAVEWVPTQKYTAAMQKLLAQDKKRARSLFYGVKRRTIVGLIAAIIALLLTATACVFHREIKDFFIQVTEKGTDFETTTDDWDGTYYEMKWVPEGYAPAVSNASPLMTMTTWEKDEYEIVLTQAHAPGVITLNTEEESYRVDRIDGMEVFSTCTRQRRFLVWKSSGVSFSMSCPESIPWEDIDRMIRSIVPIGD